MQTMHLARMNGAVSKDKVLRRFQNLLNLTYLQAERLEGGGYRIPEKIFEQIQTELDFNLPDEKQKQKLEDQIKKRYRQRNTYCFWKEFLDIANINNREDAKEYLFKIYYKLDNKGVYGSMTHSRYALETLELALDDTYNTNELILSQYSFTNPPKPNKKKLAKKKSPKKNNKKSTSTADNLTF
tara:strand:+ start:141 stop:692 length:552 start_codon:yes stop_codon:yes gene_type:complete